MFKAVSVVEEISSVMVQTQIGLSHFAIGAVLTGILALLPFPAFAQRIPIADDTLGNERSLVSPNQVIRGLPSNQIDGGAQRGANLFHSFREFNVDVGRGVYFTNPVGVANILTRVTGSNPSEILGTLGVLGNANLFLLNPNGILFGPNARLDVGGSFVASTANSIVFNDGFTFSATNPQASPLLTINVPIGLQYGSNPGSLQTQGATLQVPLGQTLALVGGDVSVTGGRLLAPGGRVELAGVAAGGTVDLIEIGSSPRLSFLASTSRADVAIADGAVVNVRASGDGNIAIHGRNINILEGSSILAGINFRLSSVGLQVGDIEINASEVINLDASDITTGIGPQALGDGGNIIITTGSLFATKGSGVSVLNFGEGGKVGNVIINARDTVTFDGVGSNGFPSQAASVVGGIGKGDAGNVIITTGSLSVTGGAGLVTSALGEGKAGNVIINARDTVRFGSSGGAYSQVPPTNTNRGEGGNIVINTGSLFITEGARLDTSTGREGNAGNVIIKARDTITLDGVDSNGFASGVFSAVDRLGKGNGGNIIITTGALNITGGAGLVVNTLGEGNSGKIDIKAQQISLSSNAAIIGDTTGQGRGGDINLDIEGTISIIGGETAPTGESTRITLGVLPGGTGSSGNLNIKAGALVMTDGAIVKASTQGEGNAGNIKINAGAVDISGSVLSSGLPSGIFTSSDTAGNAGDITIETQSFRIADGAALSARSRGNGQGGSITVNANRSFEAVNGGQLITTTFGQGRAGDITVNADQITIAGSDSNYAVRLSKFPNPISDFVANAIRETGPVSGLYANTEPDSTGRGGDIRMTTRQLIIQDGARVIVNSAGLGSAGSLTAEADTIRLDNQGKLVLTLMVVAEIST